MSSNCGWPWAKRGRWRRKARRPWSGALIRRAALEPGESEQNERDDERAKRVIDVNMIRSGLKPRKEAWEAACGNEPVDGGEREGHEAEKGGDQWRRLGHDARSSRAAALRQESMDFHGDYGRGSGAQPNPTLATPGLRRISRESSTAACRCLTASR
jgi:hypothetical protein